MKMRLGMHSQLISIEVAAEDLLLIVVTICLNFLSFSEHQLMEVWIASRPVVK